MTPYGDKELSQHWLREWLVAWRHQAITWTNADLSSVRSCGIHRRALSWEDLYIPISKTRLKVTFLESHSDLPGASELNYQVYILTLAVLEPENSGQTRSIQWLLMLWLLPLPCLQQPWYCLCRATGPCFQWEKISPSCTNSMLRNNRICKYIFIIPK